MFKFEFSTEEINTILGALGKLPFVQVADLIGNIQTQASPQLEDVAAEVAAAAEVEKAPEKK